MGLVCEIKDSKILATFSARLGLIDDVMVQHVDGFRQGDMTDSGTSNYSTNTATIVDVWTMRPSYAK